MNYFYKIVSNGHEVLLEYTWQQETPPYKELMRIWAFVIM